MSQIIEQATHGIVSCFIELQICLNRPLKQNGDGPATTKEPMVVAEEDYRMHEDDNDSDDDESHRALNDSLTDVSCVLNEDRPHKLLLHVSCVRLCVPVSVCVCLYVLLILRQELTFSVLQS